MKYESGYPEPADDEQEIKIDGMIFASGDQFRFPDGTYPLTGEKKYGLCYVLSVEISDSPTVKFFNVTEENRISHTLGELRGAIERGQLTKLDEKWGEE